MSQVNNHTSFSERFNPFPGLRPFGQKESYVYFGREGQSDEILEILSKNRFVNILGSSGTGKSSLVFSGVIPTLHGGFMVNSQEEWEVVSARPGLNPIENLAMSLAQSFDEADSTERQKNINKNLLESILRRSSRGVIEAYNLNAKLKGKNLLVYLDQFEEIFRFRKQGGIKYINESQAYVNLIIEAITQRKVPIFFALSMRSDFLGECEQFPELTNKINESHFLIPQMTREQKRLVISGPVAVGSADISNRLVQRLLNDMGDRPDQLPVLQHALMRTWDYWQVNNKSKGPIDFIHYEAIGGVNEALSRHADEAYYELNDLEKDVCERLFKTITEKRSDNDGIRRPTRLEEIAKIVDEDEEVVKGVVDRFREKGRALLMPPPEVALKGSSVIDISHEALMRVWYRLRNWVDEESASAKIYLRLSEASKNYQQGIGSLWRPPDLQVALDWRNKTKPTLKWALQYDNNFESVIAFLARSEEAYKLEVENRERQQRKRLRQTRIIASILGFASVISLGMLVVAFNQKLEADNQRLIAEVNSNEARDNAIVAERNKVLALERLKQANQSTRLATVQRQIAETNAAEAQIAREEAERQRIFAENKRIEAEQAGLLAQEKTIDATQAAERAEKSEKSAIMLRKLSVAKSLSFKSQQVEDKQLQALLSYLAYVFYRDNLGYEYDNDIYNGLFHSLKSNIPNVYEAFKGRAPEVKSIHLMSNDQLFTTGADGKIYQWDIADEKQETGKLIHDTKGQLLKKLTASDNQKKMACLINDRELLLYNIAAPAEKQIVKVPFAFSYDLQFLDEQDALLISGSDSTVQILNASNKFTPLVKSDGRIFAIELLENGKYLVTGNESGKVDLWELRSGRLVRNLYHKPGSVIHALAVNTENNSIAIGDNQGHIQILKLTEDMRATDVVSIPGHDNKIVNDILFNSAENQLISASTDGSIRMWNLNDPDNFPIVIQEPNRWVLSIALDSNDQLFAGCKERSFRKYPMQSQLLAFDLKGVIQRDLTREEWRRYVGEDIEYISILNDPAIVNGRFK